MKKSIMGRVEAAKRRGDRYREMSLSLGHSQAITKPRPPRGKPLRKYLASDGNWKAK